MPFLEMGVSFVKQITTHEWTTGSGGVYLKQIKGTDTINIFVHFLHKPQVSGACYRILRPVKLGQVALTKLNHFVGERVDLKTKRHIHLTMRCRSRTFGCMKQMYTNKKYKNTKPHYITLKCFSKKKLRILQFWSTGKHVKWRLIFVTVTYKRFLYHLKINTNLQDM